VAVVVAVVVLAVVVLAVMVALAAAAMADALTAVLAGGVLGLLFYGGLWWTVQRLARFGHPALVLAGSALLRMAAALAGFYWVAVGLSGGATAGSAEGMADGRWWRIALCLAGFLVARLAVGWYTRPASVRQARHAA
jgi:F1F0 ATPase subunit 2